MNRNRTQSKSNQTNQAAGATQTGSSGNGTAASEQGEGGAASVTSKPRPTPAKPVTNPDAPLLVYSSAAFQQMVDTLHDRSLIALDTESNSFFAYYTRVCLIQVTTYADAENPDPSNVLDWLVDPLRLQSLDPLRDLLAETRNGSHSGAREVVMHAAENDILLLKRDFGFTFPSVFDTQLAARILGWDRVGLGSILEECFGVVSDKRMQRTDWSHRPLSVEQLTYAQMDTHYLPALRALLLEELSAADRLEEAQDAFAALARLDGAPREPSERNVWSMKGSHQIDLRHLGTLEALWEWREREAQRLDRPPFKVMGDSSLVALAEQRPSTPGGLKSVAGLPSHVADRYGAAVLRALAEGERRPQPPLPKAQVRPELLLTNAQQARFERLRRWRTETAAARGVSPEIIFNNDTLLEIVQRGPDNEGDLAAIPGVGNWKARTYGESVFALLEGKSARSSA